MFKVGANFEKRACNSLVEEQVCIWLIQIRSLILMLCMAPSVFYISSPQPSLFAISKAPNMCYASLGI